MSKLLALSITAVVVATAAPYAWNAWQWHRSERQHQAWLNRMDREIACLEALAAEGDVPGRDIAAEIARCAGTD
jgi:hypothetical protein